MPSAGCGADGTDEETSAAGFGTEKYDVGGAGSAGLAGGVVVGKREKAVSGVELGLGSSFGVVVPKLNPFVAGGN